MTSQWLVGILFDIAIGAAFVWLVLSVPAFVFAFLLVRAAR